MVGVALIGPSRSRRTWKSRNDPKNKALSSFGVSATAASCSDVQTSDTGSTDSVGKHVPDGTVEKYATVPPSYGPHWSQPAYPAREFYTARDRPEMEQLVHNLEHGYTIVWYDATIKGAQLDALKDIATRARTEDAVGPTGKFIVSAWDDAYGELPERQAPRHLALGRGRRSRPAVRQGQRCRGAGVHRRLPGQRLPEPTAA